jgi:hypothetical protein
VYDHDWKLLASGPGQVGRGGNPALGKDMNYLVPSSRRADTEIPETQRPPLKLSSVIRWPPLGASPALNASSSAVHQVSYLIFTIALKHWQVV